MSKVELTLAILKPHVVKATSVIKKIQLIIRNNGYHIVRSKRIRMSPEVAEEIYGEHKERFFYNRLMTIMCGEPSEFYILSRENAVSHWRSLIGPTNVSRTKYTDRFSIRGIYGLTDARNAVHGSDSLESAKREISILFPEFPWNKWYEREAEYFCNGKVKFDKSEFVHKPILENEIESQNSSIKN